MRELSIERQLVREAQRRGGVALKLGVAGLPDRIVILPSRRPGGPAAIGLPELKAPGEDARPLQQHRIGELRELGCVTGVVDTFAKVDQFLDTVEEVYA
jgi:hypothetical protein